MLIAFAHWLRGQEEHLAGVWQALDDFFRHPVDHCSIDIQGQMGAMLLDSADRQDGYNVLMVETRKLLARILGPVTFQMRSPLSCDATRSGRQQSQPAPWPARCSPFASETPRFPVRR